MLETKFKNWLKAQYVMNQKSFSNSPFSFIEPSIGVRSAIVIVNSPDQLIPPLLTWTEVVIYK